MTELVIISLATAFVISAVDELLFPLGKWRGLVSLGISILGSVMLVEYNVGLIAFTALASSFGGIVCSMLVRTLVESNDPRLVRGVPKRIPPL